MLLIIEIYYTVSYQVYASMAQSMIRSRDAGNYNGLSEVLGQTPVIMGALLSTILWNVVPFPYILLASGAAGVLLLLPLAYVRNVCLQFPARSSPSAGISTSRKMRWSAALFIFLFNMPYVAVVSGNYLKPIFIAQILNGTPGTLAESELIIREFSDLNRQSRTVTETSFQHWTAVLLNTNQGSAIGPIE